MFYRQKSGLMVRDSDEHLAFPTLGLVLLQFREQDHFKNVIQKLSHALLSALSKPTIIFQLNKRARTKIKRGDEILQHIFLN